MSAKNRYVKLNLGTLYINKETWDNLKKKGYDRATIRDIIVGNGEESLVDFEYNMRSDEQLQRDEDWRNGKLD